MTAPTKHADQARQLENSLAAYAAKGLFTWRRTGKTFGKTSHPDGWAIKPGPKDDSFTTEVEMTLGEARAFISGIVTVQREINRRLRVDPSLDIELVDHAGIPVK